MDDFRLSISWLIRLQRGYFNPAHRETKNYLGGGGCLMAGFCNHTELGAATVGPYVVPCPPSKSSCPSLPRVSQATQASQGDEVAGAKQIGPEGARSERAQAVLLHRVLPRNTREAALCGKNPLFPSCFFVPSCFKIPFAPFVLLSVIFLFFMHVFYRDDLITI